MVIFMIIWSDSNYVINRPNKGNAPNCFYEDICTVNKNPLKNPTKTMRTSVVKFDDLSLTLKEQSGQSTWMCLFN